MDKTTQLGIVIAACGYYATAERWRQRGYEIQATGERNIIRSYEAIARQYADMGDRLAAALPRYQPCVDPGIAEILASHGVRNDGLAYALTEYLDAEGQLRQREGYQFAVDDYCEGGFRG